MERKSSNIVDVYLKPGDFYFGGSNTRIRTPLGSCVSITMWHPKKIIGGMCHFMLPTRSIKNPIQLDGHYGDEAILMFFREIARYNVEPADCVVKVFGGGKMFYQLSEPKPCLNKPCDEVISNCQNVSCKNVVQSVKLLNNAGLHIESHDVGGTVSRNIIFDIWDGKVWVRKTDLFSLA